MPREELQCAAEISAIERLLGEADIGDKLGEARRLPLVLGPGTLSLGDLPLLGLLRARGECSHLGRVRQHRLPYTDHCAHHNHGEDGGPGRDRPLIANGEFTRSIPLARDPGGDRLVLEDKPEDPRPGRQRSSSRRRRSFSRRLHANRVEIAPHSPEELGRIRPAKLCRRPERTLPQPAERGGGRRRILLANGTADLIVRTPRHLVRIVRSPAGEQLVQDHAEGVDIRAGYRYRWRSHPPARATCRAECRASARPA